MFNAKPVKGEQIAFLIQLGISIADGHTAEENKTAAYTTYNSYILRRLPAEDLLAYLILFYFNSIKVCASHQQKTAAGLLDLEDRCPTFTDFFYIFLN